MPVLFIFPENLNQQREKQLRGVKYDYIYWLDVNFGYLLVSSAVVYYQLSLQKKGNANVLPLSGLKYAVITQSRRMRFTINLSQLGARNVSVDLRCRNIRVTQHFLNVTYSSIVIDFYKRLL